MKNGFKPFGITALAAAIMLSTAAFSGCATQTPQLTPEQLARQLAWEAANPQYTSAMYFSWQEIEGGVRITGYHGPGGTVRIPPQINGQPVIEITGRTGMGAASPIQRGAFEASGITSVIIPYGVTRIGTGAFSNNHITSVNIPDSVTNIGTGAFVNNPLSGNIIVPARTSIAFNAFRRNIHDPDTFARVTRMTPEQREQQIAQQQLQAEQQAERQRLQAEQLAEQQRLQAERLAEQQAEQQRLQAERLAAERSFVGVWVLENTENLSPIERLLLDQRIELSSDGTASLDGRRVTWRLLDGNRLQVTLMGGGRLIEDIDLTENGTLLTFHYDGRYFRGANPRRAMYRRQ